MGHRGLIPLMLAAVLVGAVGTAALRHAVVSTAPVPGTLPSGAASHAPGPTAEQEGGEPTIGAGVGSARRPVTEAAAHPSTPSPSDARHEVPRRSATRGSNPLLPAQPTRPHPRVGQNVPSETQTAVSPVVPISPPAQTATAPQGDTGARGQDARPSPEASGSSPSTETVTRPGGRGERGDGTAGGDSSDASDGPTGAGTAGPPSAGGPDAVRFPVGPPVVTPPRVLSTGTMVYPGDAFHLTVRREDLGAALAVAGTEGTVAIRALVLANGTVRSVQVVGPSGSDALDRSAVDAVRHWQFAPAARDGTPIDAYVTLRIRYVVR